MRKTGNKWKTEECSRCGESHSGYSGKLDANDIEYVVCQWTNKRMDVAAIFEGNTKQIWRWSVLHPTNWVRDFESENDRPH